MIFQLATIYTVDDFPARNHHFQCISELATFDETGGYIPGRCFQSVQFHLVLLIQAQCTSTLSRCAAASELVSQLARDLYRKPENPSEIDSHQAAQCANFINGHAGQEPMKIGGTYHRKNAYVFGLCKGIYLQNMALYGTVPPFWDLGIPIDMMYDISSKWELA